MVPRSRAAATPITMAITTQISDAPSTSDSVAGAAAKISGTTEHALVGVGDQVSA